MKKFIKAILVIILIVAFISTIGIISQLVYVPWLSYQVDNGIFANPWLLTFFEVTIIFLGALLFILLLATLAISAQRKRLVVKNESGQVEVPKKTLEKLVEDAYSPVISTDKTKTKVKIKGQDRVAVSVMMDVRNKERYESMRQDIQQRIETALKTALEAVPVSVEVRMRERELNESSSVGKKARVI
jgi:hypothetical protein